MIRYKNINGHSGVLAYEMGPDFIRVQFTGGVVYLYTNKATGRRNVDYMKSLAVRGRGLSTFISTTVKDRYAFKSFAN